MNRYLCEIPTAHGLRKWVEAEGPSQAAVLMAESQCGDGRVRVIVHEDETFAFDVDVARGKPSSVRWVRDWEAV